MLILRPAVRYKFLKQNYVIAPVASKPTEETLKAHLRDIDLDFRRPGGALKNRAGQGHRAEGEPEANWGQGSSLEGDKRGRGGNGSGRGRGDRGKGGRGTENDRGKYDKKGSGGGASDVTCYSCGKKGHIKPNCPKKDEECRQCGKVGHLQAMCKGKFEPGGSGEKDKEANFSVFKCEVTIGMEAMLGEPGKSTTVDV